MTGADHFAMLLQRAEFTVMGMDCDAQTRAQTMINILCGGAVGMASALIEQHDYAAACDVIMMAKRTTDQLLAPAVQGMNADLTCRMLARFIGGADIPLIPESPSGRVEAATIDANALTDDELGALGLDPRRSFDAPAPDDPGVLP